MDSRLNKGTKIYAKRISRDGELWWCYRRVLEFGIGSFGRHGIYSTAADKFLIGFPSLRRLRQDIDDQLAVGGIYLTPDGMELMQD